MSDFAFNNYCIHCDKICSTSSIYCSDECKSMEYNQNNMINSSTSTTQTTTTTNATTSQSTTNNSNLQQSQVSPLLTPMLYIQQQQLQTQQAQQQLYQVNSPLHFTNTSSNQFNEDDDELNYFDLNYSVQSNINYTNNNDLINSTSHNYRKWLTTASCATTAL